MAGPDAPRSPVEQRCSAPVAEQRRAHDLRPVITRKRACEEAADALGGKHEGLLAGTVPKRLAGEAEQRHGTCAPHPDEVVLVRVRRHSVALDQPVGQGRPAERVVGRGHHHADLRGVDFQTVDRLHRQADDPLLVLGGPLLERRADRLLGDLESAPAHARAGEHALSERVSGESEEPQHLVLRNGRPGSRQREPVHATQLAAQPEGPPAEPPSTGADMVRQRAGASVHHGPNYRDAAPAPQAGEAARLGAWRLPGRET